MIQKKICMVGAFGVGKTSLVSRFVHSIFSEKYQTTVGVKIDKKQLTIDGKEITLVLWDLAGEDALTQVKPTHLRGSSGYLLVADGTRRNTLDVAIDLQRRAAEATGDTPFILIANKSDVRQSWEITDQELKALEEGQGWKVIQTSAREGTGVEEAFRQLAVAMLRKDHVGEHSAAGA
jgi:small GTP-binding protein